MSQPLIVGVGGAGANALDRLLAARPAWSGMLATDTDADALAGSRVASRLQLGPELLGGLGAGGDPAAGWRSAYACAPGLSALLAGRPVVVLLLGLGGGTGGGAGPAIARLAAAQGAGVVAVASLPFRFEGRRRAQAAQGALAALRAEADVVLVYPNDALLALVPARTRMEAAFKLGDELAIAVVEALAAANGLSLAAAVASRAATRVAVEVTIC